MPTTKKAKKVRPVPKGYEAIIPYLVLDNAVAAIAFYKKAFGAKLMFKHMAGKKIGHAELRIGDSLFMLADIFPSASHQGAALFLYVPDVDKAYRKAVKAGAVPLDPPTNKFYGDRMCLLKDPFGVSWSLGTHIEDVSPAEMAKRMKKLKI